MLLKITILKVPQAKEKNKENEEKESKDIIALKVNIHEIKIIKWVMVGPNERFQHKNYCAKEYIVFTLT